MACRKVLWIFRLKLYFIAVFWQGNNIEITISIANQIQKKSIGIGFSQFISNT
jgi:hypothetical protein